MTSILETFILAFITIFPLSFAANMSKSTALAFILGMLAELTYLMVIK